MRQLQLNQEQKFMYSHLDDFRAFVIDSMAENHHLNFEDHNDFIKACLAEWIENSQDNGPF